MAKHEEFGVFEKGGLKADVLYETMDTIEEARAYIRTLPEVGGPSAEHLYVGKHKIDSPRWVKVEDGVAS